MLRELRGHDQPVALLDASRGASGSTGPRDERCCGFGGLFSVQAARGVGRHGRRQALVARRGSSRPRGRRDGSCLLHLRARASSTRAAPIRTRHIAEVLAAALDRGASRERPPARRHDAARPHQRCDRRTIGSAARWPAPSTASPATVSCARRASTIPTGCAPPPGRSRPTSLGRLPELLERFADNVLAAGGHVCWAADASRRQRLHRRVAHAHRRATRS